MANQEGRFEGVEEVAERLLVDPQTVRRWIKSGKLKAYKPGREYRILSHDLEAFLESRSSPKVGAPRPSAEEGPEQRRGYPYPWMSDTLERLMAGWERSLEEGEVDGRYAHAVAMAAFDAFGAVLLMGEPGNTMGERAPENEVDERNRVADRLYRLAARAIDRYRASDVFESDEARREEERRMTERLGRLRLVS